MPTKEDALRMQEAADSEGGDYGTCVNCGHRFYWLPSDKPLAEGHVYSAAGRKEVQISGVCEYCFDKMFWVPEDNGIVGTCKHCGKELYAQFDGTLEDVDSGRITCSAFTLVDAEHELDEEA